MDEQMQDEKNSLSGGKQTYGEKDEGLPECENSLSRGKQMNRKKTSGCRTKRRAISGETMRRGKTGG
jgi:hypothetical protein